MPKVTQLLSFKAENHTRRSCWRDLELHLSTSDGACCQMSLYIPHNDILPMVSVYPSFILLSENLIGEMLSNCCFNFYLVTSMTTQFIYFICICFSMRFCPCSLIFFPNNTGSLHGLLIDLY